MPQKILSNERVALVGMTGSGKSTFARYLCQPITRLVIFDPKGDDINAVEWNFQEYNEQAYNSLKAGKPGRYRILTPLDQNWERYFEQMYNIANVVVYIDEMYGVTKPGRPPSNYLNALYTRGRSRGIGVWAATQRPSWVPVVMFSEANWIFVYQLQWEQDRKRVASLAGPELMRIPPDEHGFWIKNSRWQHAEYSRGLQLPVRVGG